MKLEDINFIRLLPIFMRDDYANIALSKSVDDFIKLYAYRIDCLTEHLKLEHMTDEELNNLAWEKNVPWFQTSMSKEQKIDAIKSERLIKERKGTVWSIKKIIETTIGEAEVKEWFEYGGDPASFMIFTSIKDMDEDKYNRMVELINETKPVRSHLDSINYFQKITREILVAEISKCYLFDYIQCGLINGPGTIGYSLAKEIAVNQQIKRYLFNYVQTNNALCGTIVQSGTIGYSNNKSINAQRNIEQYTYSYIETGTILCGTNI